MLESGSDIWNRTHTIDLCSLEDAGTGAAGLGLLCMLSKPKGPLPLCVENKDIPKLSNIAR